jgi:hypothetical protein
LRRCAGYRRALTANFVRSQFLGGLRASVFLSPSKHQTGSVPWVWRWVPTLVIDTSSKGEVVQDPPIAALSHTTQLSLPLPLASFSSRVPIPTSVSGRVEVCSQLLRFRASSKAAGPRGIVEQPSAAARSRGVLQNLFGLWCLLCIGCRANPAEGDPREAVVMRRALGMRKMKMKMKMPK